MFSRLPPRRYSPVSLTQKNRSDDPHIARQLADSFNSVVEGLRAEKRKPLAAGEKLTQAFEAYHSRESKRLPCLAGLLLDEGFEKAPVKSAAVIRAIDDRLLPQLRELNDPFGFIFPTATESLISVLLPVYLNTDLLLRRTENFVARERGQGKHAIGSATLISLLGSHLRHDSYNFLKEQVDVSMMQCLFELVLFQLNRHILVDNWTLARPYAVALTNALSGYQCVLPVRDLFRDSDPIHFQKALRLLGQEKEYWPGVTPSKLASILLYDRSTLASFDYEELCRGFEQGLRGSMAEWSFGAAKYDRFRRESIEGITSPDRCAQQRVSQWSAERSLRAYQKLCQVIYFTAQTGEVSGRRDSRSA